MDATGEGPHTSVCMRSRKPFVLCWDVEKATLCYLPIMQNLQRSSLQYLIPGKALILCRTWRPRSLMCPRRLCQSFCSILLLCCCWSIANNNASCLLVQFCYSFSFQNRHGAFSNFDCFICTRKLVLTNFQREKFFFKPGTCRTFVRVRTYPSNILIRMLPMLTVLHTASFFIRTEPPS